MRRVLMLAAVVVLGCGCSAWRGHSSFFAEETEGGPPLDGSLDTVTWLVELEVHRVTFNEAEPRVLNDADVNRLNDVLFGLKPVTRTTGCVADASVRVIEAEGTRYIEAQNACTSSGSGSVVVGSLQSVFDELRTLTP